jgi:hypothetical protein
MQDSNNMEIVYQAAGRILSARSRCVGATKGKGGGVFGVWNEGSGEGSGGPSPGADYKKCYRCGKGGHVRKECPEKPTKNM